MSGPGNCSYADPTTGAVCHADSNPAPGAGAAAADAIEASGQSMNKDTIDYILVYKANADGLSRARQQQDGRCIRLLATYDVPAFRQPRRRVRSLVFKFDIGDVQDSRGRRT